MTICTAFALW